MMNFFDAYALRARVAPVLIMVLPVIIVAVAFGVAGPFPYGALGSLLASTGAAFFLGQFGRHFGKKKQSTLWSRWDGPPTTRFLRHRNTQFNAIQRARCHRNLSVKLPEVALPTPEQEDADPVGADRAYEACTRYLITCTRDKTVHPLIFKENMNYGFLRNLWGLKPLGMFVAGSTTLGSGLYTWYRWHITGQVNGEFLVAALLCACVLGLWIFWVQPDTVHIAAQGYAERLLEYCENIDSSG